MERKTLEQKMNILATEFHRHKPTAETNCLIKIYQRYEDLQQQINNLTGQNIDLSKVNDVQNEAICSFKIFDWCVIK